MRKQDKLTRDLAASVASKQLEPDAEAQAAEAAGTGSKAGNDPVEKVLTRDASMAMVSEGAPIAVATSASLKRVPRV